MESEKRKKRSRRVIERMIRVKAYHMRVWKCHEETITLDHKLMLKFILTVNIKKWE